MLINTTYTSFELEGSHHPLGVKHTQISIRLIMIIYISFTALHTIKAGGQWAHIQEELRVSRMCRIAKKSDFAFFHLEGDEGYCTPFTWEVPLHGVDVASLMSNMSLLISPDWLRLLGGW